MENVEFKDPEFEGRSAAAACWGGLARLQRIKGITPTLHLSSGTKPAFR